MNANEWEAVVSNLDRLFYVSVSYKFCFYFFMLAESHFDPFNYLPQYTSSSFWLFLDILVLKIQIFLAWISSDIILIVSADKIRFK